LGGLYDFVLNLYNTCYWLLKLDSDGCYKGSCQELINTESTVLSDAKEIADKNMSQFGVFPNPANSEITIQSTNFEPFQVQIFNLFGQQLFYASDPITSMQVPTAQWPAGLYTALINHEKNGKTEYISFFITH